MNLPKYLLSATLQLFRMNGERIPQRPFPDFAACS